MELIISTFKDIKGNGSDLWVPGWSALCLMGGLSYLGIARGPSFSPYLQEAWFKRFTSSYPLRKVGNVEAIMSLTAVGCRAGSPYPTSDLLASPVLTLSDKDLNCSVPSLPYC